MSTIPKIIHYCWFGRGEMPQNLKTYMETWHEKMPDYEIVEWNEDNFDPENSIEYVKEAYKAKKYAFVSDYVRLCALRDCGGLYLDTDMEILKSPEKLLENAALVTGFEMQDKLITAFIAAEKGNPIITEFVERYRDRHFIREDGSYDLTTINEKFTELMVEQGLALNNQRQSLPGHIEIYPYKVFCGYNIENSHPVIDENTYTVHRFQGSWGKASWKIKWKYGVIVPAVQRILGYDRYDRLKEILHL